ncbi:hypothetical protein SPRG_00266 [Saprolegnia parasitica CBS 223.65]|uniref:SnoaL-like domain-containing protein n=1 Tax=Saprolegnia parasitica (strain CBS 223.65) TaxID=695850 RepID=A0A067CY30_SAPPC|nr:hypothetical protein SPRG_00266 [Saprolegnia parasitica CBS 223.65]KDO35418.1 hypothetical protein SPRG_00266 [Saprolegnia parasitica CBS 223.65]|eukprot:XP_012193758.1 hypothetical protein SPRG_00266 [Saprolegnia parasitica CBS 223.65]
MATKQDKQSTEQKRALGLRVVALRQDIIRLNAKKDLLVRMAKPRALDMRSHALKTVHDYIRLFAKGINLSVPFDHNKQIDFLHTCMDPDVHTIFYDESIGLHGLIQKLRHDTKLFPAHTFKATSYQVVGDGAADCCIAKVTGVLEYVLTDAVVGNLFQHVPDVERLFLIGQAMQLTVYYTFYFGEHGKVTRLERYEDVIMGYRRVAPSLSDTSRLLYEDLSAPRPPVIEPTTTAQRHDTV